tara:strand:- start:181 stop:1122 length:942 start_codon:yes stop_codon:yes gene_type:complete
MINWGILGYGRMGLSFSKVIKETSNSKLIYIGSRTANNKSENILKGYDDVIKDKNIDAIYIATLNNTHKDLILQILKSDKHILCEKPFVIDLEQALKINQNVISSSKKFFEAIAYYSHPQTLKLLEIINNNEIGDIIQIDSSFGYKSKENIKKRIYNKEFGGGAILDLACYPISFAMLFCKEFNNYKFLSKKIEMAKTGVDKHAEAKILYDNKIQLNISVSISSHLDNKCIVYGTKGKITILNPWMPSNKSALEIENEKRYYKKFIESPMSTYANQIQNVSDYFLGKTKNDFNLFDINKSVMCMKIIDKWIEK